MRPAEAQRRLRLAGWEFLRTTGRGHTQWRTPDGRIRTLGLSHGPVDRNQVAEIKRALRASTKEIDVHPQTRHQTASIQIPEEHMVPTADAPWTPDIRVYRGTEFAELIFGQRTAEHLGGLGAEVMVLLGKDDVFRLRRAPGSRLRINKADSSRLYRVRATSLFGAVPLTGRAELPSEVDSEVSIILHPEQVVPIELRKTGHALPRGGKALQKKLEELGAAAKREAAKQPGISRLSTVEDLRTALEMARSIAAELNAELYMDGAQLRARVTMVL